MIAEIVGWDVLRWLTLCSIAANIGGIGVVMVLYFRRAVTGPWWARLLPQHVWRVVLGTGMLMLSDFFGLIHRLRQDPQWYGLPMSLAGNLLIMWGIFYMVSYQRHRLTVSKRPVGHQREDDSDRA